MSKNLNISNKIDISISSAEKPGEILYYVDITVTNAQQKKIPSLKKLSDADNIVCCRDLLLNETVVNNPIFSATATKLRTKVQKVAMIMRVKTAVHHLP